MIKCVPPYCVPPSNSKAVVNFTMLIGSLSSLKNIKHGLTVKDFVMIKTTVSCQFFVSLPLLITPEAL